MVTAPETENLTGWKHIFKIERRGRAPERTRKLLPLCHTAVVVSAPDSFGGREALGSTLRLDFWQKHGIFYRENPEVEVLPVVDLIAVSTVLFFQAT